MNIVSKNGGATQKSSHNSDNLQRQFHNTRVLFVGQYWPGANTVYIARAFEQSGVVVRWINESGLWPDWHLRNGRIARRLLHPLIEAEYNALVLREAELFQPNLVYITNGHLCRAETLNQMRQMGIRTMCFYHDPSWKDVSRSRFEETLDLYDLVASTRRWHEPEFKAAGARDVNIVRFGYDPQIHRPVMLDESLYPYYVADITFVGTCRTHRVGDLISLTAKGFPYSFRIWGGQWDRVESAAPLRRYWQGRDVLEQELPIVYAASKVALHWVNWEPDSANQALQRGDQHNSRTFQIAACGGAIMMAQRTEEHTRFFKEDIEAVFFDGESELREKLVYWLDPERETQRHQMAAAARQRCIQEDYSFVPVVHGFLHRLGFTVGSSGYHA